MLSTRPPRIEWENSKGKQKLTLYATQEQIIWRLLMTRERQLGDISSKSSRGFGVPRRNVAGVTAVQSPRPWDANQNINYSSKVQKVLGNN